MLTKNRVAPPKAKPALGLFGFPFLSALGRGAVQGKTGREISFNQGALLRKQSMEEKK